MKVVKPSIEFYIDDVFQVYHEIEEQNNIIKNPKDRESDRIYETSIVRLTLNFFRKERIFT